MIKLVDLLLEGARDKGIFKAIFLAGGPGSGKSYVAQQLFGIPEKVNVSKTGLKMVNSDSELEMLLNKYFGTTDIDLMPDELFADLTGVDKQGNPVDYETSGLRDFAKTLTVQRLKLYTDGKLGVIIDGTGHDFGKVKDRRKDLMDLGYDTYMVFVNTNLAVALNRNEKRDRVVPEKIVRTSWQNVQNNMGAYQGLFGGSNFLIVQNNKHLEPAAAHKRFKMLVSKGIDKFLKKPVKSKIGKSWLRREKKNQKIFKDPGQSQLFNPKAIKTAKQKKQKLAQDKKNEKISK
jgi:predicted kinase|tara:strand:+ start:153 stop:1022 length:870 start_codon:yes stop_codon:yes gene_type:complete